MITTTILVLSIFVSLVYSARYLSTDERVEGEYFVVFKDVTTAAKKWEIQTEIMRMSEHNMVTYEYKHVLNGFAAKLTHESVGEILKMDAVDYIEENGMVYAYQCSSYSGSGSWGLRAVSNSGCGTGSQSNLVIPTAAGNNVNAYIVDTGILPGHNDFGGRVPTGSGNCYSAISGGCDDCNGHGTHVASTTGGNTYGIAKQATLYSVRVLSCSGSGSNAGVVAGIDWSAGHCPSNKKCVMNLSLGGGASTSTDNAVNSANNAGVFVAVAAGNSNANACNYSPARATGAFTVGATSQSTNSEPKASYSNYGSCMNIWAPGSSITAAWWTSNSATNTISGTSMASPHVAGVAAAIWSANPNLSVSQLKSKLSADGPNGCTSAPTGSPNVSVYTDC